MRVKEEFTEAQRRFGLLSFYDKFEHIVILILTVLIAIFIVFAIWNLALKIFLSIASAHLTRPTTRFFWPKDTVCPGLGFLRGGRCFPQLRFSL